MAKKSESDNAIEQSTDGPAGKIEAAVASPDQPQQQINLQIDDRETPVTYSTTARVWGSAEEINIDFSPGLRPTGQANTMRLPIDQRIVMNPWAAKRLALTLGQTVNKYEQTYGPLELNEAKRRQGS
jgi:hypothetical protein